MRTPHFFYHVAVETRTLTATVRVVLAVGVVVLWYTVVRWRTDVTQMAVTRYGSLGHGRCQWHRVRTFHGRRC